MSELYNQHAINVCRTDPVFKDFKSCCEAQNFLGLEARIRFLELGPLHDEVLVSEVFKLMLSTVGVERVKEILRDTDREADFLEYLNDLEGTLRENVLEHAPTSYSKPEKMLFQFQSMYKTPHKLAISIDEMGDEKTLSSVFEVSSFASLEIAGEVLCDKLTKLAFNKYSPEELQNFEQGLEQFLQPLSLSTAEEALKQIPLFQQHYPSTVPAVKNAVAAHPEWKSPSERGETPHETLKKFASSTQVEDREWMLEYIDSKDFDIKDFNDAAQKRVFSIPVLYAAARKAVSEFVQCAQFPAMYEEAEKKLMANAKFLHRTDLTFVASCAIATGSIPLFKHADYHLRENHSTETIMNAFDMQLLQTPSPKAAAIFQYMVEYPERTGKDIAISSRSSSPVWKSLSELAQTIAANVRNIDKLDLQTLFVQDQLTPSLSVSSQKDAQSFIDAGMPLSMLEDILDEKTSDRTVYNTLCTAQKLTTAPAIVNEVLASPALLQGIQTNIITSEDQLKQLIDSAPSAVKVRV